MLSIKNYIKDKRKVVRKRDEMVKKITRREMLALGAVFAMTDFTQGSEAKTVDYRKLPRWRGFNLLNKFTLQINKPYDESDFDLIAEWGFDFVRLPTSYLCWTISPGNYKEDVLKEIDQAIAFGRERRIHVNLCLHRAPGYCVNPPKEPLDLWSDGEEGVKAREQFAAQWRMFSARYKGIPSDQLSFDLVNEPGSISASVYMRAMKAAVDAIRAEDPNRLIIADGLYWGNHPVPELAPLHIAQSARGYQPMQISHYKAGWVSGSDTWQTPTWPLREGDKSVIDKSWLRKNMIEPFQNLQKMGVGVHVGEWGAFNKTPHAVVIAWMKDQLSLWREAGWGWAMWNLSGSFGPLDSGRQDVKYESYKGRQVDKEMLDLLLADKV